MKELVDQVVKKMDLREFYSGYFEDEVNGKDNLVCPFPDRHKKDGVDKLPSFRVFLDSGGTFCHGCGYKSTSPINFWADLKKVPFERALKHFWSKHIEKLVPSGEYMDAHQKLLGNPLVMDKLLTLRGITRDTVITFKLGYDGRRLTIPVFNEHGWCVNLRRYDLFKEGGPKVVSYAEGYGKARLFPQESLKAKTIFVLEGELDVVLGCQIGLACITPSGGATTWDESWGKAFKDKNVFIIPDNDKPGMAGAKARQRNISKYAAACAIIELPVKKEGEDLTDWILRYGGTAKELRKICSGAEIPEASEREEKAKSFDVLESIEGAGRTKSEELMILRAEAILSDLLNGGAFFKNSNNEMYYAREGMAAMRVTNTLGPFMSFLATRSPLINQATSTGKFIYNHILNRAFGDSELSKTATWSMMDSGVKLFVHAGKDKLLKLDGSKPHHIKNAINEDRVLLELPTPSMAIPSLPTNAPATGLSLLRELYMNNLAMQDEDRYLMICWLIGIFLRDYIKPKPIVRLLAKTASGKSTSSKLTSVLLFAEELLSHSASTVAATYEMGSKFPLVILDNLETRNMTAQLEDFLLVAATGGMKAKRQLSTDSGLILQHTNSLVLTNGIEPFSRHELIDRTMEIEVDLEKYGNPKFQEARVFAAIKAARPEIFSAILFLLHKYVLPRVRRGDVSKIMREFGQHGKERFNEYLALMCIILDAIWGYMPLDTYRRPHDLVNVWLDSQTHAEQRQDEGTNEVLYYLSTYAERYDQLMGAILKVKKSETEVTVRCTTRELLSDFRLLAKYLGLRCPWQNERQLGTRIVDSETTLNRAGWYRKAYVSSGRAHYEYKLLLKERRKEV